MEDVGKGVQARFLLSDPDAAEEAEPEPGEAAPAGAADKIFDDLDDFPWAMEAIETLALKGLVSGTAPAVFSPGQYITRADFIKMLINTLELNAPFTENFADVSVNDSFYREAGIAGALDITKGVGNNCFEPSEYITRQDMINSAAKALECAGKVNIAVNQTVLNEFTDKDLIAPYALHGAAFLAERKFIAGSGGKLDPLGSATRAEAAVLMYRILRTCIQPEETRK